MSYYSKVLYPFVEKTIRIHNEPCRKSGYCLSVDELELSEQYEFTSHMIEYHKRDLNSIYDNDHHDDIVSSLLSALRSNSKDDKLNFSEFVMDKVFEFYKPRMQEIIDQAIGWVQQEDYDEIGYKPSHHKDNGETYWLPA